MRSVVGDVEGPLDALGLFCVDLEGALDRGRHADAAPVEDSRELAETPVGDGDRGAVVSDRDGDPGGLVALAGLERLAADGAQQGERLDVDAHELDLRRGARRREAVDEVAIGDCEQHTVGGGGLLDDVVVEHRLLDRDREGLVGAEPDRVGKLARVVDLGALENADTGAAAADAEPHVLTRQVGLLEEGRDRIGERLGVAHLARGNDVGR